MPEVMRRCRQCGCNKDINQFRKYYNRKSGHYRVCISCERINARFKYLQSKSKMTSTEANEFTQIKSLYEAQRKVGLQPPDKKKNVSVMTDVEMQLANLNQVVINTDIVHVPEEAPFELSRWLTEDLTGRTPEENDMVYEELQKKFRPIVGRNTDFTPAYDDKYRETLVTILERFDEYEDQYYGGNDDE